MTRYYFDQRPFLTITVLLMVIALSICTKAEAATTPIVLTSPDGQLKLTVSVVKKGDMVDLVYRIDRGETPVITDSRFIHNVYDLDHSISPVEEVDETWKPVYGERSKVRDHYKKVDVTLRDLAIPGMKAVVNFRAYNEGIAWRFHMPLDDDAEDFTIAGEQTEFCFPADHTTWAVYSAQGVYAQTTISKIRNGCERPLTIRAADDLYIAIGEAGLVDYARMKLGPIGDGAFGLVSQLSSKVVASGSFTTPWRFVMVGDSPGQLLENNDLLLNLNEPCAIEDTSWIKPGKVIREVTLTTQGGKACVDFAEKHNLQYVEFDAGWYGHEYSDASDATTVTVDPKRSPGPLDLPEVVRYAKERGIGILLYVNRRAMEKQLDEILPLYNKWGIAGVKYGFVNVGSQYWTTWLHDAVRKAADNRLLVDIHDEYRPTGYSRTYPNLMTQEGIGGDETKPSNRQTLTILFTRMICGAGDNTICYYDSRVAQNASHAYQLAKAVCLYSPLQFVYWYDRPMGSPGALSGAGGSKNTIGDEPELEFFDRVPTVWDDTRVIHGKIGEYAVIARRSGKTWFIGCMNAGEDRTLDVPLDFLPEGSKFKATIYYDDPTVDTRTKVGIGKETVNADSVLEAKMSSQGGVAMIIEPVDE